MLADRPIVTFPFFGLIAFLVAVVGFDVVARVAISSETLQFALADSSASLFRLPGRSIWLAVPFVLLVMLSWWADCVVSARAAWTLCLVEAVIIAFIYFVGMWDIQVDVLNHQRPEAQYVEVVLPLVCVPILLVGAIVVAVAVWKGRSRET